MIAVVPEDLLRQVADEFLSPAKPGAMPHSPGTNGATSNGQAHSDGPRLRVAEWLRDRGIECRIKNTLASGSRTVYLITCPFDPSHTGGDTCIMQEPGGKLSAHCFHSSCAGRGWQEFKQQIGPPGREHYDGLKPSNRRAGATKARRRSANGSAPAHNPSTITTPPNANPGGDGPDHPPDDAHDHCEPGPPGRPRIRVTTDEHDVNDQVIAALSKVACLAFADGLKLVFEGSANLRTNKNVEQMTVINDPGLHDWHAAWIDQKVRDHETEKGQAATLVTGGV
jgi:hypothetical protein